MAAVGVSALENRASKVAISLREMSLGGQRGRNAPDTGRRTG